MTASPKTAEKVLAAAARAAGLDATDATLIRNGSNVMYQLPGGIVARIGPQHTQDNAARQVEVSRWLASSGMAVVTALDDVAQPTMVHGRPVTWWHQLPKHRPASTRELGAVLRALHALRPPEQPSLPGFDPFAGVAERIAAAGHLPSEDRDWLTRRVDQLRGRLAELQFDRVDGVVHGGAWHGNVALPEAGTPILLDLEHVSRGHPDWDLIPVAVDYADFARLTSTDYHEFISAYGGHDVTTTPTFRVLADIQELRWVVFVLSKAASSAQAARETRHRLACLRGEIARPWTWTAF